MAPQRNSSYRSTVSTAALSATLPQATSAETPDVTPSETAEQRAERKYNEILLAQQVMAAAQLRPNEALEERHRKGNQKVAKAQRDKSKDDFIITASVAKAAKLASFEDCPLSKNGLVGAFSYIMEQCKTEAGRQRFEEMGAKLSKKGQVSPDAVYCSVEAAEYSAQFKEEAKRLKLKHKTFRNVYEGRIIVSEMVRLGTTYNLTVELRHEGSLVPLVSDGVVDEQLLGQVSPAPAVKHEENTSPPSRPNTDANASAETSEQEMRLAVRQTRFGLQSTLGKANPAGATS